MFTIVDKLPKHVSVSERVRGKVSRRPVGKKKFKYIQLTMLGYSYYVPITKAVWKALHLDEHIRNPDGDIGAGEVWGTDEVEDALRDIIGAVYGQVRHEILGEIEQSVMQSVHKRIDEALHKPLMAELDRRAGEAERKALPPVGQAVVEQSPLGLSGGDGKDGV